MSPPDKALPASFLPDDRVNRRWIQTVGSEGWTNPTAAGTYNLVVVGGGPAGLVAALGAAGLGAKVALIEKHLLGGDCLNYGCVPSKSLLHSARLAHGATEIPNDNSAASTFAQAMQRARLMRASISEHDSAKRLQDNGIDVYFGEAKFLSRRQMQVAGQKLRFVQAIIATGARPKVLDIPGLAEAGYLDNETLFALTECPPKVAVIGTGAIGCEVAQALARLGSEVTLLGRPPRLVAQQNPDASRTLEDQFKREGIRLILSASVEQVEKGDNGKVVYFNRGCGQENLCVDEIVVAIGRTPNTQNLGLEAAGVATTDAGITVNAHLRTGNRRIFAAGDVCSRYQFTHAADAMARIALQNALFFGSKRADQLVIPHCLYTDPEIAHVGMTSEQAEAQGSAVQTLTVPLEGMDRAVLEGNTHGFGRIHIASRTGRLLGATLVAPHAGDIIGEVSLAITKKLSVASLSRTILPYPTSAEIWRRLADAHARTKLTPFVRRMLVQVMAWKR